MFTRIKLIWFSAILLCLISFGGDVYAQIGLQLPQPRKTVRLFEPETVGFYSFSNDSLLFKSQPPKLTRKVELDSTGKFISVSQTLDKTDILLPAVVDLETYIQLRLEFDRRQLWKQTFFERISKQQELESGAIELDIPIRIKNKTFTRIFGSDRVGLRVTGNISFDLSGRSEKRSGAATNAAQDRGSFSPRFNQTQQFTIEGKIGEKVTVSVEQNSEATFDFENTLKIKYQGDEDEIVQSVEAGNIGLSLPSTKYLIFGGSNKGLFGLKSDMKVGNFYFTGIASLEKGDQQKLTISGSAKESQTTIRDYDFMKNRYFFVDSYYRNYFEAGWSDDLSNWFFEQGRLIRQIDVYVSKPYGNAQVREGIAVLDPSQYPNFGVDDLETIQPDPGKIERAFFERLEQGKDFEYDEARGFISLSQEVRDNEILAVAFQTDLGKTGTIGEDITDTTRALVLRLLKPQSMKPADSETWPLMMRNVYGLGGSNIEQEGFDVRIEYNLNGDHETNDAQYNKTFLNLMGLDVRDENGSTIEGGDKKIDDNSMIVNRSQGVLIFPGLQPFNPLPESRFIIDTTYNVDMYNTNDQTQRTQNTKFDMIVTSKSTKSTFDLGYNVLEGSEEVLLNGSKLQRDKDYIIDYFTGSLTLVSPEARRSSSNIEIKYEKAAIFQLDKKTILGGRAEYRFWEDSFIGFTALYLNKTTLDQRVRVGQEPFRNFVWDINTSLKFRPRFLTKAADLIPFVDTNEQSQINIEAEFAQVLPNPNTLNNSGTGDNNGVAYIDDFEGSKRTTPLGIRYLTWTPASAPTIIPSLGSSPVDALQVSRAQSNIVWYNPYDQVLITDIWPNRDVNSQTGRTTDVLGFEIWRDEDQNPDSSWAGVMRSTYTFANQQKAKFIEIWLKTERDEGRLHIDVGRLSEDWFTRGENFRGQNSYGSLNTEDKNTNGILDNDEDTGVDGVRDADEPAGWPDDNWKSPDRNSDSYYGINGTEGNSAARGARYPDTEDLNGDGQVNLINEYFEYNFSLDPNDERAKKWQSGQTEKGWRQYRIPLNEYQFKVGEPDSTFQQVYYVRLWFSDLPTERNRVFFAALDFVGNEWEEDGVALNDSAKFEKDDKIFSVTVYNTEENADEIDLPDAPEPYSSPPGVKGVRDRITDALSKEQSLVYKINDLKPGASVQARKTLYGDVLSLVNYKRIRMFVHGDRSLPAEPSPEDSSKVRIYLKFGSDANNYYEYAQDVYRGWYRGNEVDIDLDELTRTKFTDTKVKYLKDRPGGFYRVVGNPSLSTVRYMLVGVKNRDPLSDFSGEIWLDELRVSDVRQQSGTALRLRTDIKMADLASFVGEWESKDADFHDIKTQFGTGSTDESQNYSGRVNVDKFLPDSWNVAVPIDMSARFNRKIPKYFPRTDILTGYSNSTVNDKLKSLFGLKKIDPELADQISENQTFGLGTNIKKRSKSEAWYLRYTIDEMNYDFDWSYKHGTTYETQFDISEQYRHTFGYKVPFGRDNFAEPFTFLKDTPVLKEVSDTKLYYTPTNTDVSLTVNDVKSRSKRRNESEVTRTVNVNSNRQFRLSYKLMQSLNFNYRRAHKADADYVGLTGKELLNSIVTKGDFGLDTDIDQGFQMDFKPKIFSWLTSDYSYSSDFRYFYSNLAKGQKQSSNKLTRRTSLSFSPSQLANMIYKPESGGGDDDTRNRSRRPRRPPRQQQKDDEEEEKEQPEDEKEEEQTKSNAAPINPLILIYKFFDSWQNIQASYTWDQSVTHSYVTEMPSWKYQFGLTNSTGVQQDTSITNYAFGPSINDTKTLNTSMNFDVAKNIKTSFSHQYSIQEQIIGQSNSRSGSENVTFLAWGDDPTKDFKGLNKDVRRFIPDWNVKITGVEEVLFFKNFAKNISVEHGRTGKYSETKKLVNEELVPQSQSFTHNFQPLVGFNIDWIWGISSNVRLSESATYNLNQGGGATRTENSTFTISASYATTGGFRIPVWPFKGKNFKNEINFTLTYDQSENITYQKQFDQKSYQENQKNESWKLRPSASYRFNKRVSGTMFYEMGATKNKISGEYSWNEFGITVNIAIRD